MRKKGRGRLGGGAFGLALSWIVHLSRNESRRAVPSPKGAPTSGGAPSTAGVKARPARSSTGAAKTSGAVGSTTSAKKSRGGARTKSLDVQQFVSAAACERWFEEQHLRSPGIWIRIAKRHAPSPSVTYAQAVEIALCFGWIDGRKEALDEHFWLQKFTPRRARSPWSRINREKAEALSKQGRMRPAGLKAVDIARADGRWAAAYQSQSRATVPADLQRALDQNPKACAFFATIASHNRYAILYRVNAAKKPETRAQRIEKFVAMLAEGKTLHPNSRSRAHGGDV